MTVCVNIKMSPREQPPGKVHRPSVWAMTEFHFSHLRRFSLLCLGLVFLSLQAWAQIPRPPLKYGISSKGEPFQVAGIIAEEGSGERLPLTTVVNKQQITGTISDFKGYFSILAFPDDTIRFSAIGYKSLELSAGDWEEDGIKALNIFLKKDTLLGPLVEVYPWPSRANLKRSFLQMEVPDDDLVRALRNLDKELMQVYASHMKSDGADNADYYFKQFNDRLYWQGQYRPITLLDPLRWAQFFQELKEGTLFKNPNKD